MGERINFEQTIARLRHLGLLGSDEAPVMPDRMPRYDDDVLGLNFFRTEVDGEMLDDLSMPRTFFGRSLIRECSFRNTDFSQSNLCWNDFELVDFSNADLTDCDLRASLYNETIFSRANLTRADMRLSSFTDCRFDGAIMNGAVLTRETGERLSLDEGQRAAIDWRHSDGEEPSGG